MKTQTLTIDIANPHFTKVITSRINDKNGLKLTVLLKNGGYPYNLSGYAIKYEAGNNSGSFVRDDCKIIDASNGVFEYTFSAAAVSTNVWLAYFAFEKGEERFTTQNIKVDLNVDVKQGKGILENYVSDFETLKEKIDETGVTADTILDEVYKMDVPAIIASKDTAEAAKVEAQVANNILSSMRDPLAYLNSVEVLCSFPARGNSTTTWIQGIAINDIANEIYIANQENNGTTLRIDVRNLDGTFKSSKTLPIESGAYIEALPHFYNDNNDLCFIVRTQNAETYSIFNYTKEILGSPIPVKGKAKADNDGNYFITSDVWLDAISEIYVYDWDSIKNGSPILLNNFKLENYGSMTEKAQGIVVNNGYIFIAQGATGGTPGVTVYNTAGKLVNSFLYTKESLAKAINKYIPGKIKNITGYAYENEGGCKYKGKLALAQIINADTCVIIVHNSPVGASLETQIPIYKIDTGFVDVTLLNSAITYAADTVPKIRRIGNEVELNGALKGLPSTLGIEVIEFDKDFAPKRNFQQPQVTSSGFQCNWQIQPNGRAKILNTKVTTPDANTWYPFMFRWFI